MRVAVCFNQAPEQARQGEKRDLIAEQGASLEAHEVIKALRSTKHQASPLPLGSDILALARQLIDYRPDVVFNLCEGFWGDARQEMNVAGLLELLRLPYTGSRPLCLGLTQDKARTKDLLLQKGLPTPRYLLVRPGEQYPRLNSLNFPLIVKPRFEDASQGIDPASVVDSSEAVMEHIQYIHKVYRQGALVEEFIEGRELNVAIIGDKTLSILPVAEIQFAKDLPRSIVCFDGKWQAESKAYKGTKPICPAKLTAKQDLLVRDVALRAYKLLECRDYARVDMRLRDNTPSILEINANPDISPDAGLARAAKVAGQSYPQLVEKIANLALDRKETAHASAPKK
jgi:D-alanine-D-alanine ligase